MRGPHSNARTTLHELASRTEVPTGTGIPTPDLFLDDKATVGAGMGRSVAHGDLCACVRTRTGNCAQLWHARQITVLVRRKDRTARRALAALNFLQAPSLQNTHRGGPHGKLTLGLRK